MRCVLLYNPASGLARTRRIDQLHQIAEVFSALGHSVELTSTSAPGSATGQTREAVRGGADIIFACGGDGTIHEVVSETGEPAATLGIIPLGSANALARHLRLSLEPAKAALQLIQGTQHTIPVGRLTYGDQHRYFIVMAGAGPDGALVYNLLRSQKSTLGRFAYYLHAARLFTTHRFHPFEIEYTEAASAITCTRHAISAMAVRVDNLGGLFSRLTARHASIHQPHLNLLILRPPAVLSLPLWFASSWLNLHRLNPFLSFVNVTRFSCRSLSGLAPHFQADGEWIDRIPVQVSLVSNALRILAPGEIREH